MRRARGALMLAVCLLVVAPPPIRAEAADEDCLACHGTVGFSAPGPGGQERRLFVDAAILQKSAHTGLECTACHSTITELPHPEQLPPVDCAQCHDKPAESFNKSVHVQRLRSPGGPAVLCRDCHGTHDILPDSDPASRVAHRNVAATCGACHSLPGVRELFGRGNEDPVSAYFGSVHAQRISADPASHAATCTSCHKSHGILPRSSALSSFSKLNVPGTCGKCHADESRAYKQSVHWRAVSFGRIEAPVCNDCHGEHRILSAHEGGAFTQPLAISQLCAGCHANAAVMQRFGLDAQRFSSYMMTYHGLAVLRGSPRAASCASCHERHRTRPASDPASTVNPARLEETCGKCHGAVSPSFTRIDVHPQHQQQRNPVAYAFRTLYVWLITLTIAGMLLHNLVIHSYYLRKKWREEALHPGRQRFVNFELVQHIVLTVSFTLLAATGFALKFPHAGWVRLLSNLGLSESLRGGVHRGAALVLTACAVLQLCYFFGTRRGRGDLRALRPTSDDVSGMWLNIRQHLAMHGKRPSFGRYDYIEKAEYLALLWGTAVMIATGFLLWFPAAFLRVLPAWTFETAEVIHYYEAWLAVLAIAVWHFYFVIFHPEQYPMNYTWLTGRITEEQQEHHHAREHMDASETKESEAEPS